MVKSGLGFMINWMTFLFVLFSCQAFILLSVFYGTAMSEILRIAGSSSSVVRFYEKTSALITRMKKQGENR